MKKLSFVLVIAMFAALLGAAPFAAAQVGPTQTVLIYPTGSLCANPNVAKSFKVVAISSATTTELVAAVAGKTVHLCSFIASVVGTNPTLLFITGTKVSTACDTAPANQSGTYAITTGALVKLDNPFSSLLTGAASGELCLTTGGTITGVQGNLTYVQQ